MMTMKSFIHFFNGSAVVSALLVAVLTIFAASAILVSTVILVLSSSLLSAADTESDIYNDNMHIQLASGELQSGPVAVAAPSLSPSSLYHSSLSPMSNVKITITSQQRVHGGAGQFIKIKGSIANTNPNESVRGGIAYISLVDLGDKIPVDLEDWSAQKGLYIPSIGPGQTLPLEWDVRLVKAGSYTVDILFNSDGDFVSPPVTSSKVFLEVSPKLNLNPGNVLPVAFGVPAVLITILGIINYTRGRKMGIYK
jgi:hypothetical protein